MLFRNCCAIWFLLIDICIHICTYVFYNENNLPLGFLVLLTCMVDCMASGLYQSPHSYSLPCHFAWPFPSDTGLGHATRFGQQDVSWCNTGRNLKSTLQSLGLLTPALCHVHEKDMPGRACRLLSWANLDRPTDSQPPAQHNIANLGTNLQPGLSWVRPDQLNLIDSGAMCIVIIYWNIMIVHCVELLWQ